jgi:hypothetical protein
VWDSDGEFLLIEAAYALPKWARKPEATTHRVFVRDGELRLVPPPVRPRTGAATAPPTTPLPLWTLRDGLRAVATDAGARPAACRAPLRALTRVACRIHARLTSAGGATLAPAAARDAVAAALAGFPGRAAAHGHTARACVPARVAALLRGEPQLVVRNAHPTRSHSACVHVCACAPSPRSHTPATHAA